MRDAAYYNGIFSSISDVKISLSDRAVFFGDAVYDMMVGRGGKIHQADEHLARLLYGADALGIKHGYTADMLFELISETVKRSTLDSYTIYIQLSRCGKKRVHSASDSMGANLLIYADSFELPCNLDKIRVITKEDKRYFFCNIKTINLLPAVLASTEAETSGCDEAVFYRGKHVTECAHSNISILTNRTIYTHPRSELILPGITRRHLLIAAKKLGIPCRELPFTLSELYSADEVLITSTTKLLRTVKEIDGVAVGGRGGDIPDMLFAKLLEEFND